MVTKVESEPLSRRSYLNGCHLIHIQVKPVDKSLLWLICYYSHLYLPAIHHELTYDVFSCNRQCYTKNLTGSFLEHVLLKDNGSISSLTTNTFFSAHDLLKNVSQFINQCSFKQSQHSVVLLGLLLSKFVAPSWLLLDPQLWWEEGPMN